MSKKAMDEATLIARLKEGSYSAFDQIYSLYSRPLYAFCLSYTKSHEDAQDIVQDVFVKLWQNKGSIRAENSIKSLLFTMAKNHLINAYRARINSPIYEEYVLYCNSIRLSDNNVMHKIEYEDFMLRIMRVMSLMSETQRKVFKLKKLQQKTNKEIAEALSLSEQTVKNQYTLSMKLVREHLNYAIGLFMLLCIDWLAGYLL